MSESSQKEEIRSAWRKKQPRLQSLRDDASARVCSGLKAHVQFRKANHVGLYFPRAFEIDLTPLWPDSPTRFFFPRADAENSTLRFFSVAQLKDLRRGYAGIAEPIADSDRERSLWQAGDIIFVPGASFDVFGNRIGSGKGFYDRFLSTLLGEVEIWGICFDEQVSHQPLPHEKFDVKMKRVVTPTRFIECSPPR